MQTAPAKLVKRMYSLSSAAHDWIEKQARRFGISKSEYLRRVVDKDRDSTAK